MNQGIDVTAIKNGLVSGFEFISAKAVQLKDAVGDLAGRTVTVVKSGVEKALPYLQNRIIAAVSTFAVSYISLVIAERVSGLVDKFLPTSSLLGDIFRTGIQVTIWIGGVAAFSSYAQLPLHALTIMSLALAALVARGPGY